MVLPSFLTLLNTCCNSSFLLSKLQVEHAAIYCTSWYLEHEHIPILFFQPWKSHVSISLQNYTCFRTVFVAATSNISTYACKHLQKGVSRGKSTHHRSTEFLMVV